MDFRRQLIERFLVHLGEADLSRERAQVLAVEVLHMIGRVVEGRSYDAAARQVLHRYAEECSERDNRRRREGGEDGAAEVVFEMMARRGQDRVVDAMRRALFDALEGRERPLDDLDFFRES